MILEEIQKAYFRNNYMNKIGVALEISLNTYKEMLKEDERLIRLGRPDDKGQLMPMFGRPVNVVSSNDFTWRWIAHDYQ